MFCLHIPCTISVAVDVLILLGVRFVCASGLCLDFGAFLLTLAVCAEYTYWFDMFLIFGWMPLLNRCTLCSYISVKIPQGHVGMSEYTRASVRSRVPLSSAITPWVRVSVYLSLSLCMGVHVYVLGCTLA